MEPAGAENKGDGPVLSNQGKEGAMGCGAVILFANIPPVVKSQGIRCSFPFFTSGLPPQHPPETPRAPRGGPYLPSPPAPPFGPLPGTSPHGEGGRGARYLGVCEGGVGLGRRVGDGGHVWGGRT